MKLVDQTKQCVERLNAQGDTCATVNVIDGGKNLPNVSLTEFRISGGTEWTPHKVEMAVWTYYILREFKPEALENLPEASDRRVATTEPAESDGAANGNNGVNGEVSNGEAEAAPTPPVTSDKAPEVTPEVPEASEATNTNGTNGSAAEASDKVPSTESETPVENGNGLAAEHSEKSDEVGAASESAAKRPLAETEPEEAAGSEAKRICSSEAEEAQAEIVAEAPNGVNSTPHPITSGGD